MTRSAINARDRKKSLFSGSDLMKSSQWHDNTIIATTTSWKGANERESENCEHIIFEKEKWQWKGFRFSCHDRENRFFI
jgi:hypothetical protein